MRPPSNRPLPEPRGQRATLGITAAMELYLVRLNEEIQSLAIHLRECSKGKTGTEVVDDGANWKITRTYTQGRLTNETIAASSGVAGATWTDA